MKVPNEIVRRYRAMFICNQRWASPEWAWTNAMRNLKGYYARHNKS